MARAADPCDVCLWDVGIDAFRLGGKGVHTARIVGYAAGILLGGVEDPLESLASPLANQSKESRDLRVAPGLGGKKGKC